jgi:tRNA A37 threonylcarbamoyladenosine biosynthesis protein TsaE
VQSYVAPGLTIWHFDLYRLKDPREARELGLEEAVDGLALIEWPERLGRDLAHARLEVRLSFAGEGRIARLVDLDNWSTRIDGDWR